MVYLYVPPRYKSPSPYVAEPRRVRFPVEIKSAHNKPLTVQILNTQKTWLKGRQTNTRNMNNKCNLHVCKWYRRRRALKRLQKIHEIEKNIPLNPQEAIAKAELEKNLIEKIRHENLQKLRAKAPPVVNYAYNENAPKRYKKKDETFYDDKPKKYNYYAYDDKHAKKQEQRERKAHKKYEREVKRIDKENARRLEKNRLAEERYAKELAKEQAKREQRIRKRNIDNIIEETKRVKKQNQYKATKTYAASTKTVYPKRGIVYQEPLANRFTNCFYRFCCQLYCYFSFFLILGFVIVVLL